MGRFRGVVFVCLLLCILPAVAGRSFVQAGPTTLSLARDGSGVIGLATADLNGDGNPDSGTAKDASRFDATLGGTNSNYFLVTGSALATAAGASKQFVDVAVDDTLPCPNRAFAACGMWSVALP